MRGLNVEGASSGIWKLTGFSPKVGSSNRGRNVKPIAKRRARLPGAGSSSWSTTVGAERGFAAEPSNVDDALSSSSWPAGGHP
jgi:hypothetical protein